MQNNLEGPWSHGYMPTGIRINISQLTSPPHTHTHTYKRKKKERKPWLLVFENFCDIKIVHLLWPVSSHQHDITAHRIGKKCAQSVLKAGANGFQCVTGRVPPRSLSSIWAQGRTSKDSEIHYSCDLHSSRRSIGSLQSEADLYKSVNKLMANRSLFLSPILESSSGISEGTKVIHHE